MKPFQLGLVHWSLRLFIGLILLATAIGKFLDVPGFAAVLKTYKIFPSWFLPILAVAMPTVELLLGGLIVSGRQLRRAAWASTGLHMAFAGVAVITLLRGLQLPNCGCFGVFWARPLTWGTVGEDVFMVGLSAILALMSRRS